MTTINRTNECERHDLKDNNAVCVCEENARQALIDLKSLEMLIRTNARLCDGCASHMVLKRLIAKIESV